MPGKPNTVRRAVVTAIVALIGLGICAAVYVTSSQSAASRAAKSSEQPAPGVTTAAAPTPAPTTGAAPASPVAAPSAAPAGVSAAAPAAADLSADASAATPQAAPATAAGPTRRLGVMPVPDARAEFAPIGGLAGSGYKARITFSDYGAGVDSITLADYRADINATEPYAVQRVVRDTGGAPIVASLAAVGVEIAVGDAKPTLIDLRGASGARIWREAGPGSFEATIVEYSDAAEPRPIARIEKKFLLREGSLDIRLEQRLVNLSGEAMTIRWYQYGPLDLPPETSGYGLDVRRFRWGSLRNAQQDPTRQFPEADNRLTSHRDLLNPDTQWDKQVWPTEDSTKNGRELVWLALTNRYFAFAVHPLVADPASSAGAVIDKRFSLVESVHRVVINRPQPGGAAPVGGHAAGAVLQLNSPAIAVAAGAAADLSIGAYAGPLYIRNLAADPVYKALGLNQLIVYNLGGFCAPCTFPQLAAALIWFLRLVHDNLLFDWSLAIMVLVLAVRTLLHPITRRSQIGLARFSKQMQALAPKQAALREKYKDEPKRMQIEMARLMKEEGVNIRGALGCLPMFLQMPVWIALYAMLFFAFELRHTPGFFGVFQALTGGKWSFLADLSAPDHFIEFGRGYSVPLISGLMGPITGVNILPLILGVVFFIQQKYLTPAASTALTPEQELQQKMMKWMMVVMFPLMMFNAPSGLAIYFITNSTLGIIESRWIRKHIDTLDPATGKKPAAKPDGPAGFWRRFQDDALRRAEEKRAAASKPGAKPRPPGQGPNFGQGKR